MKEEVTLCLDRAASALEDAAFLVQGERVLAATGRIMLFSTA